MKLSDSRITFAAVVDMPQAAYDYASGKEFAYTYRDGAEFGYNLFDPDGLLEECNEEIEQEERGGMDEERLAELREAAQGLSQLVALCAKEGVSYVSL
jgi:hypothetical protein